MSGNLCERLRMQNVDKIQNTSPRVYLSPLLARFVDKYSKHTGLSKSKTIENAVKEKFNSLSESERNRILNSQK